MHTITTLYGETIISRPGVLGCGICEGLVQTATGCYLIRVILTRRGNNRMFRTSTSFTRPCLGDARAICCLILGVPLAIAGFLAWAYRPAEFVHIDLLFSCFTGFGACFIRLVVCRVGLFLLLLLLLLLRGVAPVLVVPV